VGYGSWGGFAPYVSKAQKMAMAAKTRAALAKKGIILEPISVEGRKIAQTWWGTAWSENLERYADYSNRIPRGRTYVRNGSVLDLKIARNEVTALVAGSRPQPYKITIGIESLDKKVEHALLAKSRTSLDSMQALLSGQFPADLQEEFFKQGTGLFPTPREITLDCSCPDWADMCKHVAAALYGVAVRLDQKPELFFVLRGIEIKDFVGEMVKTESRKMLRKAQAKTERTIAGDEAGLSALFGIEMDGEKTPDAEVKTTDAKAAPVRARKKGTASARSKVRAVAKKRGTRPKRRPRQYATVPGAGSSE